MPRRNRRPLGPAEKAARARMDEAAKSVLGHRSVLARILKGFIGEFQNVALAGIERECIIGIPQIQRVPPDRNVPVCIPGMAQEDTALDEGKVVYDILPLAKVPSGKAETWVHINVESQNDFCPGYPLGKRGICRLARMISGQHESVGHHQQYGKPEKVCSIWICTDPPARRRNTVSRFRTIEEILTGNVRSQKKYYDLRSLVMICLGDPNQGRRGMRSGFWMCCLSLRMGMQEKNDILEQEFGMTMEPGFPGGSEQDEDLE